jgi:hypothetical protein
MPLSSAPTPLLRSLYGATDNIDGAIASGLGLMIVGLNPDKLAAVSEEIGFKHPKTEVCTFVLNFSEGPWLWMCLQFRPSPHHSVRSPPISTHPSSNRINLVVALKSKSQYAHPFLFVYFFDECCFMPEVYACC